MSESDDPWLALLRSARLRPTAARLAILTMLGERPGHYTVEAMAEATGVPASTVARTVHVLVAAGLLRPFDDPHGRSVAYERCEPGHHDHLVCLDCGHVHEVGDPRIEARQEALARELGFAVVSHRHILYGRCEVVDCPWRSPPY